MRGPALPEDQVYAMAAAHNYESLKYGKGAKRMRLEDRFESLFNAYIDLCNGSAECDKAPTYLSVSHHDLLSYYNGQGFDFSRPAIFSYFKTRDVLSNCIIIWAKNNFNAREETNRTTARKIALQFCAVHGHTDAFPAELKVTWSKVKVAV